MQGNFSCAGKQYTLLARIDWLLLFAVTFPVQFVRPFRDAFSMVLLMKAVIELGLLLAFWVALGIVVDRIRGKYGPPSVPLDKATFDRLQHSLNEQRIHPRSLIISRMRVVVTDYSMGAHIRGVIFPYVVISGGMLTGLLKKNSRANAILSHEIAHLEHFDRFLPGFIGLAGFNIAGMVIKILLNPTLTSGVMDTGKFVLLVVIYQFAVSGLLISAISKSREYYADAKAISLSAVPEAYCKLLEIAATHDTMRFDFFHPRLSDRVRQAKISYLILRRAWFWKIYLVLGGSIAMLQWLLLDEEIVDEKFYAEFGLSGFLVCLMCLLLELFRGYFLRTRRLPDSFSREIHTENWRTLEIETINEKKRSPVWQRVGLTAFLFFGFLIVAITASTSGTSGTTVISIGGAIVYGIYMLMKSK